MAPLNPPASEAVPYTLFTKNERRWIVAMIALAGWFSTLSSFIYYPAIPVVADDLGSSIAMIDLTVTSYLAVSAIAPAVVGDAADTFGRRPLYAVTLTLYLAANVGVALQHSAVALLLLRMLQSAGISVADATRITTAPSLGPVLGGAFASGPGWRWIFWFLAMASGFCLLAMTLALPETHRAYVGNGGTRPARLYRPVVSRIMRPWKGDRGLKIPPPPCKPPTVPNPIKSLRILSRKDVAVSIMPGSFLYTVYCCIRASLATTLMEVYRLNKWQAGLIYLPFGLGAIASTLVSSKWIDHDYRVVARAHGLPINKVSGDDLLRFPIEQARIRSVFLPTFCAFASVLAYGWLVDKDTVSNATCMLVAIVDRISISRPP
ncbi:hypothetical protein N0V84_006484 [Fusarium piperis]|uniref:Uncharacterized protein n=1 Tax=Fusarium piperis TaxID=1435070 RepID=A0A9W8WBS3_9HYPO|nr:hypothetical protein N0V84_006484 [Fusarium piperis]